jgi:hypothetical protein
MQTSRSVGPSSACCPCALTVGTLHQHLTVMHKTRLHFLPIKGLGLHAGHRALQTA